MGGESVTLAIHVKVEGAIKDPKTSYALFCAWTLYALDLVLCFGLCLLIDEAYVWTMLDVECVGLCWMLNVLDLMYVRMLNECVCRCGHVLCECVERRHVSFFQLLRASVATHKEEGVSSSPSSMLRSTSVGSTVTWQARKGDEAA